MDTERASGSGSRWEKVILLFDIDCIKKHLSAQSFF